MLHRLLFIMLLSVVMIFPLSLTQVNASEFVEGKHYLVLNGAKTRHKEVREFFSFYCPHCFNQEPFWRKVEAKMPRRAKFIKNHVQGMPNRNSDVEKLLTKAVITAEKMRMRDKVIDAFFKRINVNKQEFKTAEDIKQVFMNLGASEFMYDSTASSFSVDMEFDLMKAKTNAVRAQGHSRVPTVVVNGIYMPLANKLTNMEQYQELVLFLLKK